MLKTNSKRLFGFDISYLPLLFGAAATIVIVYIVYSQTQSILKVRLQQRIEAMVSIAALQIDPEDVSNIIKSEPELADLISDVHLGSAESFNLDELQQRIQEKNFLRDSPIVTVTQQMKKIRESSPDIIYIYLWRKTDTPNNLAFVTDSDTVYPVDWDENGKIDEVETPPLPGEEYDISDMPIVGTEAFEHSLVLDDFLIDKWGTFLSGFAPIKNSSGNTVAILGMDVDVSDFSRLVRATLIPFAIQAILLLILLSIQTLALIKIWRNRVELVKELDRQKDELLSIVSHQLVTPVSSVKWYLEMLLDGDFGKLNEEQAKHLSQVKSVTVSLTDLVHMILDVSRIQLGRMKVDRSELDLHEFFEEVLVVINPKIEEKKQKFNVSIPTKFPKAMLDRRLMRMTLENLLTNAVKYTPEKGIVDFDVHVKDNKLFYTIKDTGCGIPKNEQNQIFGKLFRASNVQKVNGNGFGLFVAKGAVEAQGGSIRFSSKENQGTTFYVELPLNEK